MTRALGIEAPVKLQKLLNGMPPGVIAHDAKTRLAMWSLFFNGTMTKLAHVESARPFILFYNPIADVALVQGCERIGSSPAMDCQQSCALPGEVLTGERIATTPRWLASKDPLGALQQIADARVRGFSETHPPASQQVFAWRSHYCSPQLQAASEERLIAAALTVGQLNARQFLAAADRYLLNAVKSSTRPSTSLKRPDPVIDLLAHVDQLSLSGAVARPQHGWIVFVTPKGNGWHDAALILTAETDGSLRIEGALLMELSSKAS